MSSIRYRPEIDGLRAVAVSAVLIYHAKFSLFGSHLLSGGALGVDIFFVISGFLITSILFAEISAERFSFIGFYDRRARRILPALLFVILSSLVAAWILLLPEALTEFSQSVVATLFFAANFFFYGQDSYLAEASQLKPMLHMWSLGVEEQFYLISPVVLLLLWKYARRHLMLALCIAFCVSLALAQWASTHRPDAGFYLLPTRAWELLAGAMLAKVQFDGRLPKGGALRTSLSMIGGMLIVLPLALYPDTIRHPNVFTAVPVLGTVLVIAAAGGRDPVSAILRSWPFVALGRISYSLYLWHLPVLVFARIGSLEPLSDLAKVGLLALSVLLATASWFWVEQPFRRRDRLSRIHVIAYAGSGVAIAFGASVAVVINQGYASRFPAIISKLYYEEAVSLPSDSKGVCMRPSVAHGDYCTFGKKDAANLYFAVGDSHMQRFSMALIPKLPAHDARLVSLVVGTCPYGLKLQSVMANSKPKDCIPKVNDTRRQLFLSSRPSVVFVGARLPWYLGDDPGLKPAFVLRPDPGEGIGQIASEVVVKDIRDGITELLEHGDKVVLIYPVPTASIRPALYLSRHMPKGSASAKKWLETKSNWYVVPYAEYKQRAAESYRIYDGIPDNPLLLRIYPEKIFCNTVIAGGCLTHDLDSIYYADNDHLSLAGNQKLLKGVLDEMARKWPDTLRR